MRAGHRDLWPLDALADAGDIDADAGTVRVLLAGHLLLRRQDRLHRAQVDVDHARVGTLLDLPRDDVALATAELSQHGVIRDVTQALVDDLLGGEGSRSEERRVGKECRSRWSAGHEKEK